MMRKATEVRPRSSGAWLANAKECKSPTMQSYRPKHLPKIRILHQMPGNATRRLLLVQERLSPKKLIFLLRFQDSAPTEKPALTPDETQVKDISMQDPVTPTAPTLVDDEPTPTSQNSNSPPWDITENDYSFSKFIAPSSKTSSNQTNYTRRSAGTQSSQS
ncbi:MAG: hypothetical protein ACREBR_00935 [bacterium]